VTIQATAPGTGAGEQYVWNGWTGNGIISYTGTDNPAINAVTMNGPITEAASWTHQYYLTVTSPYGTPGTTPDGPWYDEGDTAYATVTPLTVPGPGGAYNFIYWLGDATGNTSPSDSIYMDGPKTALATWTFTPIGGGPTGLVIDWFGTIYVFPLDGTGRLLGDVHLKRPNVELIIPAGTLVLGPGGIMSYIWTLLGGTPPPPEGTIIVADYQFLPSGVTFVPGPAQLIITYDPTEVPAGSVVVIAYYDETTGTWVEVETAGYVAGGTPVPDTVTCNIFHFTYFAVLAKLPK
jgi:hypothetical protein